MNEPIVIGNGLYRQCGYCEKWVKVNKCLFGSLHICLTDGERRAKEHARAFGELVRPGYSGKAQT